MTANSDVLEQPVIALVLHGGGREKVAGAGRGNSTGTEGAGVEDLRV